MNRNSEQPKSGDDAILAELRAARRALLEAVDFDLERLAHKLRAEQAESGHPVVSLPCRRPVGYSQ